MIDELLLNIAKLSPLFAILVIIIFFLKKEYDTVKNELKYEREECKKEINEIYKELRDTERNNILILNKLSDVLIKITSKIDNNHIEIDNSLNEIKNLINKK